MIFRYCLSSLLLVALLTVLIGYYLSDKTTPAPNISFATIDGKNINLRELQGHPVLVNFWATNCPGCMQEIPHLIELHNKYHQRGLHIIAVAMVYDPPNRVVSMAKNRQLPYAVALDIKGAAAQAFGDVKFIPSTFLIAPDGNIVFHKTGLFQMRNLQGRIESMLGN